MLKHVLAVSLLVAATSASALVLPTPSESFEQKSGQTNGFEPMSLMVAPPPPVPETSTLSMMVAGLGALLALAHRRRSR